MTIINELRWTVAETLIGWALSIAPKDSAWEDLAKTLMPWMKRHLKELRARHD